MALYLVFSLLLLILLLLRKEVREKSFFILSFIVIVFYWGFSYIDVPDMPGYQSIYYMINPDGPPDATVSSHYEYAFMFIMWFFRKLDVNFYCFQFCLFAVETLIVSLGIKRLGTSYRDLGAYLCIIAFWIPIVLLGALRQGIAIALFIYSLHFMVDKKYLQFLLIVIVSFFFHKSAIFLLLFPLWELFTRAFIDKKTVLLIIFMAINLLHFAGFSLLSSFDNFLSVLFSDFIEEGSSISEYTIYLDSNSGKSNYGLLKVIELDFCYLVALFFHHSKEKNEQLISSLFLLFFTLNMLLGGIVVHRISYYLQIPYYLLIIRAFCSFFEDFSIKRQWQLVLTYLYALVTTILLSRPFSSSAIHEYHLLDILNI